MDREQLLINVGSRYARPLESHYAMVRRCLATNSGRSYASIAAILRRALPNSGSSSAAGRLAHLQGLPDHPVLGHELARLSYRRQCPICAKHLYHTDVFTLPWLSHCPIHHCELTTTCPTCGLQWPSQTELSKRHCPTCGLPSFLQLPPYDGSLDVQPIADIIRFITDRQPNMWLAGSFPFTTENAYLLREIPIDSLLFPACQAHRNPIFTTEQLDSLHIVRRSMQRASVKIKRLRKLSCIRFNVGDTDLTNTSDPCLRNDFKAMKHLLAWIYRQGHRHPAKIMSYRYMSAWDFVEAPNCCPYCLALSIWFFHSARHYHDYPYVTNHEYPFMESGFFYGRFGTYFPEVYLDAGSRFSTDRRFANWFYQRILELSFTELLKSSFDWFMRIRDYKVQGKDEMHRPYPINAAGSIDYHYSLSLIDGHLQFFYPNEHSLDDIEPPSVGDIQSLCNKYTEYRCENIVRSIGFIHPLNPGRFTYNDFIGLQQHLRRYIHMIYDEKFPSNLPNDYSG